MFNKLFSVFLDVAHIFTFVSEATKLGRKREHFANPFIFTSEQICTITDKFDNRNLIGPTQFGKVYRGKICEGVSGSKTQNVIVKIWDEKSDDLVGHDDYLMVEARRWIKFPLDIFAYMYQYLHDFCNLAGYSLLTI